MTEYPQSCPLVSVVITTRNEGNNIENCLQSIVSQTYNNIEPIVVDNNSQDKTKEIALGYTDKVYDKGPERSAQRNYGMLEIAKGKYVMFIDADMILSPCLVGSCVTVLENQNSEGRDSPLRIVALHISEVVLGRNYWSKVRRFERTFYDGTVVDGARFFLKEAFAKVGGFDESMSGPEDWDIDKKIKQIGKIALLDRGHPGECRLSKWPQKQFIQARGINPETFGNVIYHNESEFDMKSYLGKKRYYARSFDGYMRKWGKDDPDIHKQFGLYYRFAGIFVEDGKWKKLLLSPHLTAGMYLLRTLVGLNFILRDKIKWKI